MAAAAAPPRTTVEPVRDPTDGDGSVAPDLMRNIPPGGGGPGV